MVEPAQPWHVPVRLTDVPETGLHLDLVADEKVRAGLAALGDATGMPRLEAVLDVVRHGRGLRVTGRVSATVEQNCVVTLEPVENRVDEPIDVIFAPPTGGYAADRQLARQDLARQDLARQDLARQDLAPGDLAAEDLAPEDLVAEDLVAEDLAAADLVAADLAAAGLGDATGGEPPEVLSADGTADVGAIAAEFLLLGIDRYPRKPGAEFKPPDEQGATLSPFAALAKLRKRE